MPTFVEIAGGPKGNDLKAQIERGAYPGIVKTTLDGVNQRDYLEGKSEKSGRDTFFYYTGATPSAVRYKNWKIYFTMEGSTGVSALAGPQTYGWAQVRTSGAIRSSRPWAKSRSPCCPSAAHDSRCCIADESRAGRKGRSDTVAAPDQNRTGKPERHAGRACRHDQPLQRCRRERQCRIDLGLLDRRGSSRSSGRHRGYVQQKIADHLNELVSIGVAGFRIDGGKHMRPQDLAAILAKVDDIGKAVDPKTGKPFHAKIERPYLFLEVIGAAGEPVKPQAYTHPCRFEL